MNLNLHLHQKVLSVPFHLYLPFPLSLALAFQREKCPSYQGALSDQTPIPKEEIRDKRSLHLSAQQDCKRLQTAEK